MRRVCVASALAVWSGAAWSGDAWTASDRFELGVAAEGVPDTDATAHVRTVTDAFVRADLGDGWSLTGAGALRIDPGGGPGAPPDESDLYRLGIGYDDARTGVAFGRVARTGLLGRARLDGVVVRSGAVTVWGGRIGHVEPVAGDVFGGGAELTWRPDVPGQRMVMLAGYEARHVAKEAPVSPGLVTQRLHLATSMVGPRSGTLDAVLTAGLFPEPGLRLSVSGETPVGSTRLLGSIRWEGAPRHDVPETSLAVVEAIGQERYGVAEVGAQISDGVRITAGTTVVPGDGELAPRLGGTGRVVADAVAGASRGGVFAAASTIGTSWYAGGGLAGATARGPLDLSADVGLYRFRGLAGEGWIGEARLHAEGDVGHLRIGLFGSAGTDRMRAAWLRGGFGVRGWLG